MSITLKPNIDTDYNTEAVARMVGLEARFHALVNVWKKSCPPSSSVEKLVTQPAYQQIIGMGPDALVFILRKMEQSPNHWFWALRAITGENPVQPANRGDIRAMTADWFAWAKLKGYQW